ANTFPSGREVATKSVSPEARTPPPTIPESRVDQRITPLLRSTAYTFRSTAPAYSMSPSLITGEVNRRPVRAVHTWAGAFPAVSGDCGGGGGRRLTQAALTPPRSRARLNAPQVPPHFTAKEAWRPSELMSCVRMW